jgi:SPIRAL1-like protein
MRVRAAMSPEEIDRALKQVLLKDLRIQCRARGISPAGGKEQLAERVREHMLETGDL